MAEFLRRRRFVRWPFVLALVVAVGVGVLAHADRLDIHALGLTLASVRDSSADAALAAKVRGALALSRRAAGMKVDVVARSGAVTLGGRVASEEARSIVAEIAADTPGVESVRNDMVVDPRAASTGYEQTLLDRIGDLELEATLQDRLRRDPELAGSRVKVQVQHGLAMLRGVVEDESQRAEAQRVVAAAVGADRVRNDLELRGADNDGDKLARRVAFELYSTGAFDMTGIQTRSEAGRLELEGVVRSEAERLLAAQLAEKVPGVGEIVNHLRVAERAS
jgi:hyperosmotically inducible periplasmic protein